MAMEMLATTLGLPNDPSLTWNQREDNGNFQKQFTTHKISYNLHKEIR
jgi:hypothetical protein